MITSSFINSRAMHLTETVWVFIVPALFASGLRAGLFIFIFRQFFSGMPPDLEEAARIDGCGYLRTFVRIIVPLAVPAIITVALFSFIWHWNEYYLSAIYFNDGMPLPVMLKRLQSALINENIYNITNNTPDHIRTYLQGGCLLVILPPLALYIFTQRFFTESVERTGIVG
jgi:multiple sugar transport system permease protein